MRALRPLLVLLLGCGLGTTGTMPIDGGAGGKPDASPLPPDNGGDAAPPGDDAGGGDAGKDAAPTTITMGVTTILPMDDSGNGNVLLAQQAKLGAAATLRSLSFYVTTPAGKLRLGVYDNDGALSGPGTKLAETAEITPVAGWNTANVTTPKALGAGDYWLAYAPSDSNLHFVRSNDGSGLDAYQNRPYGPLPNTFLATNGGLDHWSFYATLTVP